MLSIRDRKAQSGIITTVLIILIVLISVVIVWLVVQGLVKAKSSDVDIEPLLLSAEIENFKLIDDETAEIKIKRKMGGGTVTGVRLIFEDSSGNTYLYENESIILEQLGTYNYVVKNDSLGIVDFTDIEKVDVHYIFEDAGDKKFTQKLDSKTVSSSSGGGPAPCTETCATFGHTYDTYDICGVSTNCDVYPKCSIESTCGTDGLVDTGTIYWNETSQCVGQNLTEQKYMNYTCNTTNDCEFKIEYLQNLTGILENVTAGENDSVCTAPDVCDGNGNCVINIPCVDGDGDGYNITGAGCGAVDCNDSDVNVNPGVAEVCDGIDNNCGGIDVGGDALCGGITPYCFGSNGCVGCITDPHCGVDEYSPDYCSLGDVFRDLTTYSCNVGSCESLITPQLVNGCDDVDECTADSCSSASCVNTAYTLCNELSESACGTCALNCQWTGSACEVVAPPVGGIPSDFISWWKFDTTIESGTKTPDENGVNNGTIVPDAAIGNDAELDENVLILDGVDDYVDLDSPVLSSFSQSSVCSWINIDDATYSHGSSQTILNLYQDDDNYLRIANDEGSGGGRIFFGYRNNSINYGKYTTSPELESGVWKHVCYTFDGVNFKVYINGSEITNLGDVTLWEAKDDSKIGRRYTSSASGEFKGMLDDMIIYNKTLTAQEITDIYDNQSYVPVAPCDLTSASWSTDAVDEGTLVQLTVEGINCDGEGINFTIIEDDLFGGNDYPVNQPVNNILFSGNAVANWVAEYQEDGIGGISDPPEYYFKAYEVGNESNFILSEDPKLSVSELVVPPSGDTYYVSYSGSEAECSFGNPCDLDEAISQATYGDEIIVEGGDYEQLILSGEDYLGDIREPLPESQEWITIRSFPGETAIFSGGGWRNPAVILGDFNLWGNNQKIAYIFDGVKISGNLDINEITGFKIINSEITGNHSLIQHAYGGITLSDSNDITIDNCTLHTFSGDAIGGTSSNFKILNNDISNYAADGIHPSNFNNLLIENNTIHNTDVWNLQDDPRGSAACKADVESCTHSDVLQSWDNSGVINYNFTFRNNIVRDMWQNGIGTLAFSTAIGYENILIENNVFKNLTGNQIVRIGGNTTNVIIRNNTLTTSIYITNDTRNIEISNNIVSRISRLYNESILTSCNLLSESDFMLNVDVFENNIYYSPTSVGTSGDYRPCNFPAIAGNYLFEDFDTLEEETLVNYDWGIVYPRLDGPACDGTLNPVDVPVGALPCIEPPPCELEDAQWNTISSMEGDTVQMNVQGNRYCVGNDINYSVWKQVDLLFVDWLWPDKQIYLTSNEDWVAGFNGASYETGDYYFRADLFETGETISSKGLPNGTINVASSPTTPCHNGIDDDLDGYIDYPLDWGCDSIADTDEINEGSSECSDGIDNDGDTFIDKDDNECLDKYDNIEDVFAQDYSAYWDFQGDYEDASDNNYHGTPKDDTHIVNGDKGQVLELDGSYDRVEIGDVLDMTDNITISAWVNLTGTSRNYYTILGKEDSTQSQYGLEIINSSGNVRGITFETEDSSIDSIQTITRNIWTHIAFTYDGNKSKLYINGEFDSGYDNNGSMNDNSEILTIGYSRISGGTYNNLEGQLDDIIVYNRALSLQEISDIYNEQKI